MGLAWQEGADREVDIEASKREFTEVTDADSSRPHALFLVEVLSEQFFFSFAYKDFVKPYELPWKPSMIVYEIYSFLSVAWVTSPT